MPGRVNPGQLNLVASKYGKEKNYWLNKLSGVITSQCFPYDYPGNIDKRSMKTVKFEVPVKLSNRLMQIAAGSDIRIHMILTAGIVTLLYKYTKDRDILVGIPIYKQKAEGEFTNTVVVIRNTIEEHLTFKKLIIQVKQLITEGIENANYPIETLLYHLNISSSWSRFPLFDVAILLENIHHRKYLQHIRNNMTFSFRKTGEHLGGTLEYNASLFKGTTVQRILDHFLEMLLYWAFNVDSPVSGISILPQEEKKRILYEFNNNRVEIAGDKTICQLFAEQAAKLPNRVAVVFERKELTYGEMNKKANQLARVLRNSGIHGDRLLGILLDRSPRMVESILAVWKAGGAYIPIDPHYPPQRIVEILKDSSAEALLTGREFITHEIEERYKGKICRLEKEIDVIKNENPANLDLEINMNSLAYVIYTSGSTGNPKGVMIEHIGMMNHIHAKVKDLGLTGKSIVAQNASHTFDISIWQFFAALTVAGRIVIYPNPLIMAPDQFISWLKNHRITILEVVPSYLSVMLEAMAAHFETLPYLRFLLVTGETVRPTLLKEWFIKFPGIPVVNAYGPTEASDDITHYIMDKLPDREFIPIGKPVRNLNIYIVDNNMSLCPIGLKGEICVSGLGVGRGYLNAPEKTQRVFMEDPFAEKKRVRLYKTGDIGCWTPGGVIDFLGRTDSQVKIRGYRIELREIENKLLNYPKVKEAVVVVHNDKLYEKDADGDKGDQLLCAYVVGTGELQIVEVRNYLLKLLPDYMVPKYFVELERIPLTPNGKVDRKALPEPGTENGKEMVFLSEERLNSSAKPWDKGPEKNEKIELELKEEYELSQEEREKVLYSFNDTAADFPRDKTVHQLFEAQVQQIPTRIAVVYHDGQITSRELNQRANQLASVLRLKGIKANSIVCLMVGRSLEMITGLLAILKAGGAYLPVGAEYPQDRVEYMLKDCHSQVLITDSKEDRSAFALEIININEVKTDKRNKANLPSTSHGTDLIHVLYTSGTTGIPKGALIEHKSVLNLLGAVSDLIGYRESDTVLSLISISFDFFGLEVIPALTKGLKVVIGNNEDQSYSRATASTMERENVTIIHGTPSNLHSFTADEETAKSLKFLRHLIVGGEIFPETLLKNLRNFMKGRIYNIFGPTETTIFSTVKELTTAGVINIGKPINNTYIYILNSRALPQPIGVPGELCIGGEGVARGYLARKELNQEKFIPNPFIEGDRLYRTGDLARWLPEGDIDFLGRIDHQVKIKGFRIEPGEIESLILKYKGIQDVLVTARKNMKGDKYLCAFLVCKRRINESDLREYLSKELPSYLLPSFFIRLEKMPLTPNGKVNRILLESIDLEDTLKVKPEAPRDAKEEALARIWANVLGRETVGINENFFMIGGDSIKTIQVASRMKKAGYKVEMKDIFEKPTIAQLAPFLKKLNPSDRTVNQTTVTGTVPLTPIQKAFFLSSPIEPHHFNMAVLLFSKERLDEEATRTVFGKIQEHHDALRMTFKESNREIIQTNHGLEYPLELKVYDLKNLTQQTAVQLLEQEVNKIQTSIDLEKGPLMKLGLFHLHDGDRLLIVIHHLVVDGVSWRILLEDADRLYHRYKNGESLVLPLKTHSFKEWSEKLSHYANSESFLEEKTYWTALESTEIPGIEKDFEEEINSRTDSETLTFHLSLEDTALLLTKVNEAFATGINEILLTALGLAVRRSFGIKNVLVGLESHGREEILKDINVQRTVGWFTCIYPVLLDISYKDDLARQIKEIKETLRRVPNKGIGYGVLKNLTAKKYTKDMEFNLKPQISFNYLGQFDEDLKQMAFKLAAESTGDNHAPAGRREYDLDILGMIMNKQLEMSLTYNKKQFKKEIVETLCVHFKSDLIRIISFCSERETKELTPSDFSYKNISLEQLDSIFD